MRRYFMPGLFALAASTIYVHAATPSAPSQPQPQSFRKLEFSRTAGWEVAAIGNDEKVNHCALTRGAKSAELTAGEPKFTVIADGKWTILRVRDVSYQFTEKKALEVTVVTAEGAESKPLAATGGPDLADIRFTAEEREALLASKHLDVRMGEGSVRLSFANLREAKADFDKCMANVGAPAKGWSKREVDNLITQVKRGTAKCTENKRTGVTMCDVN